MPWKLVEHAHTRCSNCGAFPVDRVWRWFDGGAVWSHDWCQACVDKIVNERKVEA